MWDTLYRMSSQQELDWIAATRENPEAFTRLYDAYFPRLYAYMSYRVEHIQDVEDLVADVFLKVVQQLQHFSWRHEGSFAAWLFRIAHNTVADFYRQREPAVSLNMLETKTSVQTNSPSPEEAIVQGEYFTQLRRLLKTLSPRRQEVIRLKFFGGLRNQEIASILALDERTVASHLCRGLRDLYRGYSESVAAQGSEKRNDG